MKSKSKRDGKKSESDPVTFGDQQIRQQRWVNNKENGSEGQTRKHLASQKEEKKEKVKEIVKRNNVEPGYGYSRGRGSGRERKTSEQLSR